MSQPSAALPLVADGLGWNPGGTRVLGPLDLTVQRGELLVIVGPNGAGKTSLLRLLGGLLEPDTGTLRWGKLRGAGAERRRNRARQLVYLPQLSPLSIPLTVREFVRLGRYPHRDRWTLSATAQDHEITESALARLELLEMADRSMVSLSGGERQRVSLAAALAQGGAVWLLDEPTTYLDPRHQVEIASILQAVHRDGHTLVVTTHDLNLAAQLATRVVALEEGRILAQGAPRELLTEEQLETLFGVAFTVESSPQGLRIWPRAAEGARS